MPQVNKNIPLRLPGQHKEREAAWAGGRGLAELASTVRVYPASRSTTLDDIEAVALRADAMIGTMTST